MSNGWDESGRRNSLVQNKRVAIVQRVRDATQSWPERPNLGPRGKKSNQGKFPLGFEQFILLPCCIEGNASGYNDDVIGRRGVNDGARKK
jgi:hypothetical protein